jgi:undecaprenyl-diphosphatase
VRFLSDRVTPGHLGLELTSALAVAGVGFYVFVLYVVVLSDDPGPTHGDRELLELADDLHGEPALDVAQFVTDLGSFVTVAALVLGTVLLLLARRHFTEVVALVAGAALVYVAVRIAKDGIDRPRPTRRLEASSGSSFPSGHAAYATIWVGVALVAAAALRGVASRAALVSLAVAIAVAIGLSRVYLRVHFWSDVAGGWGLGAGILGACAAIALVVSYIRQNEGESATSGRTP